MFVGILKTKGEPKFTHLATKIPFPPTTSENGVYYWHKWNAFDSTIDIHEQLREESFIGAVSADFEENSVTKIEILVDGRLSGTYSAETGKRCGRSITVPVGAVGKSLIIRVYTWIRNVTIQNIEILGAYDDKNPLVWPTPKSITYLGGRAKIKSITARTHGEDEKFAASFLKERIAENLGRLPNTKKAYSGERYTVETEGNTIIVTASSRLALLYGADTILQLTTSEGVSLFNCDDKPTKELRGFHAGVPRLADFEFMRRFYRYVLLPLRYNVVFVQITAAMRFDRHPEISEAWLRACEDEDKGLVPPVPHRVMSAGGEVLEKDDIRRYVGYIKELGFEVVPEVQSLGHIQYITIAHPEIAEVADKDEEISEEEDARPDTFYYHSYCPSLDESYKIIFDIIDEIIEVVKPQRCVHIGHDEVYEFGICKRCRDKNPAELMAHHINALYNHIKEQGLSTMMWADMLQPAPIRTYNTSGALDLIPKDIILLDFIWYFNFDMDTEDTFTDRFKVGIGNLYSSHFPRYKERIMKKNVIGGQMSAWTLASEHSFANLGKMWDTIFLSEMLWNTEGYDERNKKTYYKLLAKHVQPNMRDLVRDKYSPRGYKKTLIPLPKSALPVPKELKELCPHAFVIGDEEIKIGRAFDRLVFEHTTLYSSPRGAWDTLPESVLGRYVITYEDGASVDAEVIYAENVLKYHSTYGEPKMQALYRHTGYVATWLSDPAYEAKDEDGKDVTVLGYIWENPTPEKKIATVKYIPRENEFSTLVLAGIKGLKK